MQLFKSIAARGLRYYVMRMLAAFAVCVLTAAVFSDKPFTDASFCEPYSFPLFAGAVLLGFFGLCFLENDKPVLCILFGAAVLYSLFTAAIAGDGPAALALCALPLPLIFFFGFDLRVPKRMPRLKRTALIGMIAVFTLFAGGLCCVYYRVYRTPCFDFGLFAQMFYYMKETGLCLITCERDRLLSHFAVHFSPIYYLLLPVYALIPSPCTLLVLQALVTGSAIVPLAMLCRKYGLSDGAALLFCACLTLYPAFLGANFWYLHENCFLLPCVLWLTYFMEQRRMIPAFLFALLTLSVKEDAAVYTAVIALYFLFGRKNYKCSIPILIFSVVYFFIVTNCMKVYGEGIMDNSRYGDYIYDDTGLFCVIKSVLMNPGYAVKQIFEQKKYLFLLQMLVPLGFLPLAIKKPAKLILLIPLLLVNLMTSYKYQYDIGFQYTFGSGGLLFYMAVTNYGELGKQRSRLLCCAALSALILFAGGYAQKTAVLFPTKQETAAVAAIDKGLSMIPKDASLSASSFLLANVSQRKELYELERTSHRTQYVAADLRYGRTFEEERYAEEGYRVIYYEEGVIEIMEKKE